MGVLQMNFLSRTLGLQTNVTICLPSFSGKDRQDGREKVYVPGMKFQVLWLLHGGSGDDSDYLHFSNIARYAESHKLAVVMPSGYNSNYMDTNSAKYMQFVAEELPELCRAYFPFSDKREDNFIGGLSMGSNGAQWIALHYPENYAAVLGMSCARIYHHEYWDTDPKSSKNANVPKPAYVIEESRRLAEDNIKSGKKLPVYYMTWGDLDPSAVNHKAGTDYLRSLGYTIAVEEEVPGYAHEWDFWDMTLRKALNEWLPIRHSAIYPGE